MGNGPSSPDSCGTDPYNYPTFDDGDLPRGLKFSLKFLDDDQVQLCRRMCEMGQEHFFEDWEKIAPGARRTFVEHLQEVDANLPNEGLEYYIDKVRRLLHQHRQERNPLEGWTASAPYATPLKMGGDDFDLAERWGLRDIGKVGFVLNASEMGTDVGFNDVLVKMRVELTTNGSYLQAYIQHILAIQARFAAPRHKVPLCLLVSEQTEQPLRDFLDENKYFGMEPEQIIFLKPSHGVPVVENSHCKIAIDPENQSKIYSLPEGDGCIHTLMFKQGVTEKWINQGIQYVYFFEGANALALQALPFMLYTSKTYKFLVNYLTVPRQAKQTMDALVKLTNKDKGLVGMMSVDHRNLDDFLKKNKYFGGDRKDELTGDSPFPGSTRIMLIGLSGYHKVLIRTEGELPGSLSPTPSMAKTKLLEPVRAVSRATDISQVLNEEESEMVGMTSMEANFCYAPVKVSAVATAEIRRAGMPVYTASTAEFAVYHFHRRALRHIGCKVEVGPEEDYHDLSLAMNPNIVFHPLFCLTLSDYKDRFPEPSDVQISRRSTLVVRGSGVLIPSLKLDGCMLVDCDEGYNAKINGKVWNLGWEIVPMGPNESDPDIGMRGYQVDRRDQKEVRAGEESSICIIL